MYVSRIDALPFFWKLLNLKEEEERSFFGGKGNAD